MKIRRHRQYRIPAELLATLLELDDSSDVVHVRWDAATDTLVLVVSNDDFAPVAIGAEAPIHAITIAGRETVEHAARALFEDARPHRRHPEHDWGDLTMAERAAFLYQAGRNRDGEARP